MAEKKICKNNRMERKVSTKCAPNIGQRSDVVFCGICEKPFKGKRRNHSLNRHHLIHTGQISVVCGECGEQLRADSLERHRQRFHLHAKEEECLKCGKMFTLKEDLERHTRIRHKSGKKSDNFDGIQIVSKKEKCPECGKMFTQTVHLIKTDTLVHTGDQPDERGKESNSLDGHVKIVSKKEKCPACGKMFSETAHLIKTHTRVHTGDKLAITLSDEREMETASLDVQILPKKEKCPKCGRMFARKSEIKAHIRTHTGEKPFKCRYCARPFGQLTTLQRHEQGKHENSREHKCDLCDKTFVTAFNLRVHTVSHTGMKNYKCDHCPNRYSSHSGFRRHQKKHLKK